MKTINHKDKTLHHHAPTGFYIDLAAMREFVKEFRANMSAAGCLVPLLVKKDSSIVVADSSDFGKKLEGIDALQIWTFAEMYLFDKGGPIGFNSDKPMSIGQKHYYHCPHVGQSLIEMDAEFLLKNDWFPVSACYSPARIMLENAQ